MTDVDALASDLRESFGRERSGAGADFTIAAWERLRAGEPIPRAAAVELAADSGLSLEDAETLLGQSAERDAAGDIVGFSGLSLNDHPTESTSATARSRRGAPTIRSSSSRHWAGTHG